MFDTIQVGDRVTIRTPQGQEVTGRAVMFNRKVGAWVLNLGGRHGIPGMACERNFIKVSKAIHTTDQETGETFSSVIEAAIAKAEGRA